MSGEVNGKSSTRGEISYKSIIYAKSSNYLSYDTISDIPVSLDTQNNIEEIIGRLDCKINYKVVGEIASPRLSKKQAEFSIHFLPPANSGDQVMRPTIVIYRNEFES